MRLLFEKVKKYRFLILAILLAGFFWLFLEFKSPYYFLEDDNRDFSLGNFALYLRAFMDGSFPVLFNYHQFLGNPIDNAMPFFYPFAIAAPLMSLLFTGGALWSVDILGLLHIITAAIGMYLTLREMNLRGDCALAGSFLWAANPFPILIGANWCVIWPAYAWLPFIFLFTLRLLRNPRPAEAAGLAASRLLLFYGGYPQYYAYALIFEFIFVLLVSLRAENPQKRFWTLYAASHAATLLLSLPLLLPTLHQMTVSATRAARLAYDDFSRAPLHPMFWLWGLAWPHADVDSIKTGGRMSQLLFGKLFFTDWLAPYVSHIGYAALAGLVYLVAKGRDTLRKNAALTAFAVCAVLSMLWAFGALDRIIYLMPALNRLRWTFKLGLFLNFYLVLLAACGLALWADRAGARRRLFMTTLWAVIVLNFGVFYTMEIRRTFIIHPDSNPIAEPLASRLADARIFSLGYKSGSDSDSASLGFNYASVWGLYHFGGYDALVSKANNDAAFGLNYIAAYCGNIYPNAVTYFRKWGVRWYIAKADTGACYAEQFKEYGIRPVTGDDRRVVFMDPQALPMLRWENADPLPVWTVSGNRLYAQYPPGQTGTVTAAFLYNPFFVYSEGGGKFLPALKSPDNQIEMQATGTGKLILEYRNPYYRAGLIIAGLTLLLILTATAWLRKK